MAAFGYFHANNGRPTRSEIASALNVSNDRGARLKLDKVQIELRLIETADNYAYDTRRCRVADPTSSPPAKWTLPIRAKPSTPADPHPPLAWYDVCSIA